MIEQAVRSTQISGIENVGLSNERLLNGRTLPLPVGTTLVSSDNHWTIYEDIFYESAPAELKERMPRIWTDESGRIGYMGVDRKNLLAGIINELVPSFNRAGLYDLDARMGDLDADGVAMEIVYPQWLMFYLHHPDLLAREWIFRIYNEYMAGLEQRSGGRFFGVGIPNYWDMSKSRDSVQHIRQLGLKAILVPIDPGLGLDGKTLVYASSDMTPLWAAIEESGLPATFHIGENPKNLAGPGGLGSGLLATFQPFRLSLGELIFGGIFDRHPGLRVVFAEAGINWIPGALQDAEMTLDGWGKLMTPKIALRPTEYWARHCYGTFMADEIGLRLLDYIGEDHIMWATDYPHNEGTHGYSDKIVQQILDMLEPEQARKVLGGNAIKVFNLPH